MAVEDKDIGLKIGNPLEKLWTTVKEASEELIMKAKNTIIIEEAVLKLANKKIKEHKL